MKHHNGDVYEFMLAQFLEAIGDRGLTFSSFNCKLAVLNGTCNNFHDLN